MKVTFSDGTQLTFIGYTYLSAINQTKELAALFDLEFSYTL